MRLSDSFALLSLALLLVCVAADSKKTVIKMEELKKANGKDTDKLWLAVLGEVYDVAKGHDYYGEGGPYSVFVGRHGCVPFVSGNFTAEEAAKPCSSLEDNQLLGVEQWREFYEKEEKYPLVGILECELFDKDGKPTEEMEKLQTRIQEQKKVAAVKDAERKEKIKQRRLKKEAAEKEKAMKEAAEAKAKLEAEKATEL